MAFQYGPASDAAGPASSAWAREQRPVASPVSNVTTATVDWNRQARADVEATGGLKYFVAKAETAATFSYERAKSADLKLMKVSVTSPIARALIGKYAGDVVEVNAPSGIREYEILEVRYI